MSIDGLIATLEKNPVERICICKRQYRGYTFLDIRLFFLADDDQWKPTRKGVTLSVDLLEEFKEVIAGVTLEEDAPARRR